MNRLRKLLRYSRVYGWARTRHKVAGRIRWRGLVNWFGKRGKPAVSVIGCGQFSFSTVCFFVQKHRGNVFLSAYDTNWQQAATLARHWNFAQIANTPSDVFNHPALQLIYVASNHASHAPYAIEALQRHIDVCVEKPIAVTREQLVAVATARRQSKAQLWAGYNRPYSQAIGLLKERVQSQSLNQPFSISYLINGHQLPANHWYRQPDEGTRICGNFGHWLDLTIHCWSWREKLPTWIDIQLTCANPTEPDDNLTVILTTDYHDLVTLVLTSRTEPFEGIQEYINLQYGALIAQIDDFQKLTCWQGAHRQIWQFRPKDVGHERAVLQPFNTDNRPWREVELSTLLMLFIRDRLLAGIPAARFMIADELANFDTDVLLCPKS